jgi:uncharacterized protein (DUF1697 family)
LAVFVVLLRAIGPITHKIMSMAQWRDAVDKAGFESPQTYLATGNMIVEGDHPLPQFTQTMNDIVRSLGLADNNVGIVRTADQLRSLYESNPLPEAAIARPSQMGVYFFANDDPEFGWLENYEGPEALRVVGSHLVVDTTAAYRTQSCLALLRNTLGSLLRGTGTLYAGWSSGRRNGRVYKENRFG